MSARTLPPVRDLPCDGTTHNQGRNCHRTAAWQIKIPADRSYVYAACPHHLHQVSTEILGGERGALDIRRIKTEGC